MADKFINSLLPRSILMQDTFTKLTAVLGDIKVDWQAKLDTIRNAYDIDKLQDTDLIKLIESFSLKDIYNSIPPYFHGATLDENGSLYGVTPVNKVVWMRDFLKTMLRLRRDIGIPELFDQVMGLLKVPDEQFVILQNFDFFDGSTHSILPRRIYSKLSAADLALKGYVYTDAPDAADVVGSTNYYTPTQTISIDVLTAFANQLGDEFMTALQILVYFLKPTHVIIQDIAQAVFLYTDQLYNINLSERGAKYNTVARVHSTGATASAPGYEFTISGKTVNTAAATNRIIGTGFITDGWKTGMVITTSDLTVPVNAARIIAMDNTYLELNTADVTLADETSVAIDMLGDYDHSFQDVLIPFNGKTFISNSFFTVATNRIARITGDFRTDGFKIGALVTSEGFAGDNNVRENQQARITSVVANYITLDKNIFITTLVTPSPKTIRLWNDAFAESDFTMAKPVVEKTSETMHPAMHQPGMLPTLATHGGYGRGHASARLDKLDTMHYNTLNGRAGGDSYFGFCVTGNFTTVAPHRITRASGSWIVDGFELGCLISSTGFTNPANNIAFVKVIGITSSFLDVDPTVTLVNEVGTGVQVCVDMLQTIGPVPIPGTTSSTSSTSSSTSTCSTSSSSSSLTSTSSSSSSSTSALLITDLFFVGNGGTNIFSDPACWSLTQGGTGGAGVPGILNRIYFYGVVGPIPASPDCYLDIDASVYGIGTRYTMPWLGTLFTQGYDLAIAQEGYFSDYGAGGNKINFTSILSKKTKISCPNIRVTPGTTIVVSDGEIWEFTGGVNSLVVGRTLNKAKVVGSNTIYAQGATFITAEMRDNSQMTLSWGASPLVITYLDIRGSAGALASITGGKITVSTVLSASYVTVVNNDASSGVPIVATTSVDGTGNTNWTFLVSSFWVGTTSVDWSDVNNWASTSGGVGGTGAVPDAATCAVFEGTPFNWCVLSTNSVCASLDSTSLFRGRFSDAGYTLTATYGICLDASGSMDIAQITLSGTVTTGNAGNAGYFIITGNFQTYNVAMFYVAVGSGELSIGVPGMGSIGSIILQDLSLAATGKFTNITKNIVCYNSLTLGTGTLLLDGIRLQIQVLGTTPLINSGATIIGTGTIRFASNYNGTVDLPAITMGGSTIFELYPNPAVGITYRLQGALIVANFLEDVYIGTPGGSMTFDSNDYAITVNQIATFGPGGNIWYYYFRNSVVQVNTVAKASGISFETSTWTVDGNWTTTGNIDPGTTAQITFTASAPVLTTTWAAQILPKITADHALTFMGDCETVRLVLLAGETYTIQDGKTLKADTYTAGDWDGVTFRSVTTGVQWNLDALVDIAVFGVDVQDSAAVNRVNAEDASNIDSGNNNANWDFTP